MFFDPDNGIEVKSRPMGRKNSSKYVYWSELSAVWNSGSSLLVYQHFTREPRTEFLERLTWGFRQRLGTQRVLVLRTSRVAFFLVPQERWVDEAEQHASSIQSRWYGRIEVQRMGGRSPGETVASV